jgi:hypothetical protein
MEAFENIVNKDMQSHTERLKNTDAATAANYGVFWIAPRACEVMEIRASWSTAGSSTPTLNVERLQGVEASGAGDSIIIASIAMSGTANTVNLKEGIELQNQVLNEGDRLGLVDAGTLTALDNLVVTVLYKPSGKGNYK